VEQCRTELRELARDGSVHPAWRSREKRAGFAKQQRAQFFGRCIVSRMIGEQRNCGNF
jgi:hypothetical protein